MRSTPSIPEERAAFEAHYPTCETCSADLAAHRATAAGLAGGTATTPPPQLRDNVLSAISQTRQDSPLAAAAPPARSDADPANGRAGRRPWQLALVGVAATVLLACCSD